MRRFAVRVSVTVVVLLTLMGALALGGHLAAQDAATPEPMAQVATEGHPLVGTWIADTDLADPANPQETFIFTADGAFISVETGDAALGTWAATGASTAILTLAEFEVDEEGNALAITIRATIEVGADGNSFTAAYTLEVTGPDGTSTGEAGPAQASGTRLVAEAPGTPVMTLDELFGEFEGTPEATPSS
jgi:hypothetical protein